MGLVLDSTAAVAAERRGKNVYQLLAEVAALAGDGDIVVSVITLLELAHGVERADSPQRYAARKQFLDELILAVLVQPVSVAIALRAGQIDGWCQARGVRVPLSDLLIGATALELGYQVATANVRHFRAIPGLTLLEL